MDVVTSKTPPAKAKKQTKQRKKKEKMEKSKIEENDNEIVKGKSNKRKRDPKEKAPNSKKKANNTGSPATNGSLLPDHSNDTLSKTTTSAKKAKKALALKINLTVKGKKRKSLPHVKSIIGGLPDYIPVPLGDHSTPIKKSKGANKKAHHHHRQMPAPLEVKNLNKKIKIEPPTPNPRNGVQNLFEMNDADSFSVGKNEFLKIIHPIPVSTFMDKHWEKKPLLVQRKNPKYFEKLISRSAIDNMLRTNNVEYTKNIDITSYKDGERQTHNSEGRALPPDIWSFYGKGCSIRILNPQTFIHPVYKMNVKLQEYFHCMTGANVYLTPPNSQGFAPHYDDIEAFVLQIEGKKHWKVYEPRTADEQLARVSSENFTQDVIGEPILDVVLEAGDLLYFPRGFIHQASTVPGSHSLHVTMSVYQKNCWADLLELMLPIALAATASAEVELRAGVPLHLNRCMGIAFSDTVSNDRNKIIATAKTLFHKIFDVAALDDAVDQLCKKFQHDALPPLISEDEKIKTVFGNNYLFKENGTIVAKSPITREHSVKLLRMNILRLVAEEEVIRIYYHTDNSREYHEYEPNFLEVEEDAATAVEALIKAYPKYVDVANLPVADPVDFVNSLWERGLLIYE